jgi:hypothetical protein
MREERDRGCRGRIAVVESGQVTKLESPTGLANPALWRWSSGFDVSPPETREFYDS